MLSRSCSHACSMKALSTEPDGSMALLPRKPPSSWWFGLHIVTWASACVKFMSSSGVQRSGTGSQTIIGFAASLFIRLRAVFKEVQRDTHRAGLQTMWNDFDISRCSGRDSVSMRSLGVVYLKARF